MKKLILFLGCLALVFHCYGQQRKYSTFHKQRSSLFELLPVFPGDIIFLGNSITNGGEWSELFNNPKVKNRGISGDIVEGIYGRLAPILKGKPAKIFLMIGVNDIALGASADSVAFVVNKIVEKVKSDCPETKLYLQSVLPVSDDFNLFGNHTSKGEIIKQTNVLLLQLAKKHQLTYIDLYSRFKNENNEEMNAEYTNDGLHLLGKGYILWRDIVLPFVTE